VGFEANDQGGISLHPFIEFGTSVQEKEFYICRPNLSTHCPRIANEKVVATQSKEALLLGGWHRGKSFGLGGERKNFSSPCPCQ
jgi:hypothetical protein